MSNAQANMMRGWLGMPVAADPSAEGAEEQALQVPRRSAASRGSQHAGDADAGSDGEIGISLEMSPMGSEDEHIEPETAADRNFVAASDEDDVQDASLHRRVDFADAWDEQMQLDAADQGDVVRDAVHTVRRRGRPLGSGNRAARSAPPGRGRGRGPGRPRGSGSQNRRASFDADVREDEPVAAPIGVEDSGKEKRRSAPRVLQAVPECGFGNAVRTVSDYHLSAPFLLPIPNSYKNPYAKQPGRECDESGRLLEGSFGNDRHLEFEQNADKQNKFAQRWFVPRTQDMSMRAVSSDVEGVLVHPTQQRSQATSEILHCIKSTSNRTELNYIKGPFIATDGVHVGLQHTSRELQLARHGGPFGGMMGLADDWIFKIRHGAEVSNVDEDILFLVTNICEGLQGQYGVELSPSVSTNWTRPFTRGQKGMSRVQHGAQTRREYSFAEAQERHIKHAFEDLNPTLEKRLWRYKHDCEVPADAEQRSTLIVDRAQTNNVILAGERVHAHNNAQNTDPNLVTIFLWKHIVPGWDVRTGEATYVTIDAINLVANYPGNDPIVLLQRIVEMHGKSKMSTVLTQVFNHMNDNLGRASMQTGELFNTDKAGAATLVSAVRMQEAFFRYCARHQIVNVNLGGFRLDVNAWEEMQAWNDYASIVDDSRREHFRKITDATLDDRQFSREINLPVESFNLFAGLYTGQNYRKIHYSDLQIEAYVEQQPDNVRDSVDDELRAWVASQILEFDPHDQDKIAFVYLQEGEPFANNCGIYMRICTDSKRPQDDTIANNARRPQHDTQCIRMAQPRQDVNMVHLYLQNAMAVDDPLHDFLIKNMWIPCPHWIRTEMHNLGRTVESVINLKDAIGDDQDLASKMRLQEHDGRVEEIWLLTGKKPNPMHAQLHNIRTNARLHQIHRLVMDKITCQINMELSRMQAGELEQWRAAAMDIQDLKKQQLHPAMWRDNFAILHNFEKQNLHNRFFCSQLHDLNHVASMLSISNNRIDAKLSYMNHMIVNLERLCTFTHAMNTPRAYGQTVRLMDMAGTTTVLKEIGSDKNKQTVEALIDYKSSGTGADQTEDHIGMQDIAFLKFLGMNPEGLKHIEILKRVGLGYISKMMINRVLGSAYLSTGRGSLTADLAFLSECGNVGFCTEFGKNDGERETVGHMESRMAHSGNVAGANSGVRQQSWTTTQAMEQTTVTDLRKLPITLITGNRPCNSTPASAVEGARWMCVPSSVLDGMAGVYACVRKQGRGRQQSNAPPHPDVDAVGDVDMACFANDVSTGDIRVDIKGIDCSTARANPIFLLLCQWMRRCIPLLGSALTLDPVYCPFFMRTTYENLESSVNALTTGVRRGYLQAGNVFHRNAQGPWGRVLMVGMHAELVMGNALLSNIRRSVATDEDLELYSSFIQGIKCMLLQPISITAMLASLYLWLAETVLDIQIMIVACYVYHFTAFQSTCPGRVLSLALREAELTNDEEALYMAFCEHLAPVVLQRAGNAQSGPVNAGPKHVCRGLLETPSQDSLDLWNSHATPANYNDIRDQRDARLQSMRNAQRSEYVQTNLPLVSPGFKAGKDSPLFTTDKNETCTPERIVAQMFAQQQMQGPHRARQSRGLQQEHENTPLFWDRVNEGTHLPKSKQTTNDDYRVKFQFVPFTGMWWENVMQTAGNGNGIVKMFLLQSGLSPATTHFQFFEKLFRRYLSKNPHMGSVYGGPNALAPHTNAWDTLVLDRHLQMFEWVCLPHMTAQQNITGIDVNISMRLVHYVIMQGLGVTHDWQTEIHDNTTFVSSVHLRNMSHMALGCMSMILHTCVEKTVIPANDGLIYLPFPSPEFDSRDAAAVVYDERLHFDSVRQTGKSSSVLCVPGRVAKTSTWVLLQPFASFNLLTYKSVVDNCPELRNVQSKHDVFPFPPEAVTLGTHMFDVMLLALRKFNADILQQVFKEPGQANVVICNEFACAMQIYGKQVQVPDVTHYQMAFTQVAVQDCREMPFVTWGKTGYMFTMLLDSRGQVHVQPTRLTHDLQMHFDSRVISFAALDLRGEDTFGVQFLNTVCKYGFACVESDGEGAEVNLDMKNNGNTLAFWPFPVVHYPVLVLLKQYSWLVYNCRHQHVRVASNKHFLQQHRRQYVFKKHTESWFVSAYPELERLIRELQDACDMHCEDEACSHYVCAYCEQRESVGAKGFWLMSSDDMPLHFQSADALLASLQQHAFRDTPKDSRIMLGNTFLMAENASKALVEIHTLDDEFVVADFHALERHRLPRDTEQWIPCFIPHSASAVNCGLKWGLAIEHENGKFLHEGEYSISCVYRDNNCSVGMDFVSMSRCMLTEGTELWLKLNPSLYTHILNEAEKQQLNIKLPVSAQLHEAMRYEGEDVEAMMRAEQACARYLRCFYVLGGSNHSADFIDNSIHVMLILANRNSPIGHKGAQDDTAGMESFVNQHIDAQQYSLIRLPLAFREHDPHACLFHEREANLPFYKYVKLDFSSRGR